MGSWAFQPGPEQWGVATPWPGHWLRDVYNRGTLYLRRGPSYTAIENLCTTAAWQVAVERLEERVPNSNSHKVLCGPAGKGPELSQRLSAC